jgi:hypothetical protein
MNIIIITNITIAVIITRINIMLLLLLLLLINFTLWLLILLLLLLLRSLINVTIIVSLRLDTTPAASLGLYSGLCDFARPASCFAGCS